MSWRWAASRRDRRRVAEAEARLERIIEKAVANEAMYRALDRPIELPADDVATVGQLKVNMMLARYGLPPARSL